MNTTASTIPQEDSPERPKKVLRLAKRTSMANENIQALADNRWCVHADANLLDLADDLNAYPMIPAVGVTDENGRLLGQIIRNDLLELLGRPFGRDVLQKENVIRVARNTKSFRNTTPVLKVCAEIGHDSLGAESGFFPLRTAQGDFTGIFSIQGLLVHLANRTQSETEHSITFQQRILKEMQILETPALDLMTTTFRVQNDGSEFFHLRQYDQNGWHLSLCSPGTAGIDTGLVVSLLWGVVNSFELHKGLMNYVRHLNALVNRTFAPETGLKGLFLDYHSDSDGVMLCDHGDGLGFIHRGGKILRMKTAETTTPIGIGSQLSTEIFKYQLRPGDRLFILGNGFTEQSNTAGESYGPAHIKAVLEANPDASARNLRQLIHADFKAFRGTVPQVRDAALFILHRK